MLEVIDSFSRKRAESAELIRSAAVAARATRQASSEIIAWCSRDAIRRDENEDDSREYLIESIRYVMRIGNDALTRRKHFEGLATTGQAKREQLVNDAQELREYGMLEASEFQSIRDLDIQLLQIKQWAEDDGHIYDQSVDSLNELYDRYMAVYPTRTGQLNHSSMLAS